MRFIILVCLIATLLSCKGDDNNDLQVPRIPTDVNININLPQYSPLQNPGGWVYALGGSKGLIIYRISQTDFGVFDRHCTYEVAKGCIVEVDPETNITAFDPDCCASIFNIIDGAPTQPPAIRPLLQFNYQFNSNSNMLRVYN